MTSVEIERRRVIRAEIPLDVVIQAGEGFFYAETRDLSEMGFSLLTKKPFAVGTHLHVVLGQPPNLPRIDLEGVVKWMRHGDGIGVEFDAISPQDKSALAAFLKSLPEPPNLPN
jgi:c-di-GMP-binding flagellar brake protein YcgR